MKPVVAPQQSTVPHKNTTVPSQTELKPELPQKKVTKQERVPQCPSSVERRRQKAKEIYFAHDMSSIGFMLPHREKSSQVSGSQPELFLRCQ